MQGEYLAYLVDLIMPRTYGDVSAKLNVIPAREMLLREPVGLGGPDAYTYQLATAGRINHSIKTFIRQIFVQLDCFRIRWIEF